jgi:adenylosuccinate lyase
LVSFIAELFNGDHEKVKQLNKLVCEKMGFNKWVSVSGQTYTRKLDFKVLSCLSGLAQSAYKMCSDIRLLASMKEIGERYLLCISKSAIERFYSSCVCLQTIEQ